MPGRGYAAEPAEAFFALESHYLKQYDDSRRVELRAALDLESLESCTMPNPSQPALRMVLGGTELAVAAPAGVGTALYD